jgi:4-carboxymuconolactone decarboxylase
VSESTLYETGLDIRRAVLGASYVDRSIANADAFMSEFQTLVTEWCWGRTWGRPGLEHKTRSLLNLAMLTALGKPKELQLHVRGALANGVTTDEIMEVLLHATVYCGNPAGLEAFTVAHEALVAEDALPARPETSGP